MNRSDYVVQALIDDENMSADLAALYPAASKIGDAAASFIDKADTIIEKEGPVWPVGGNRRQMRRHLPERRQGRRGHQPTDPQPAPQSRSDPRITDGERQAYGRPG